MKTSEQKSHEAVVLNLKMVENDLVACQNKLTRAWGAANCNEEWDAIENIDRILEKARAEIRSMLDKS